MTINYLAILAAAIASWIAGGLWYGLLGKPWRGALGWTEADLMGPDGKKRVPIAPFIISFVAELVMAAMMAGLITHLTGAPNVTAGLVTGALSWVGFVATIILVNNAYQKRRFLLTLIDSGHWLAVLLIQGVVIGLFG